MTLCRGGGGLGYHPPGLRTPRTTCPPDYVSPPGTTYPSRLRTPPRTTYPLRLCTPPDYITPRTMYPSTMYPPKLHTPRTKYPPPWTLYVRAVRILLECILVSVDYCINFSVHEITKNGYATHYRSFQSTQNSKCECPHLV